MQYIQEDGIKCFVKDSCKEGCFYVVGGMDVFVVVLVLVIGEGYVIVVIVVEVLGYVIVVVFDFGNLQVVVEVLYVKFLDKFVVIVGDDDCQVQIIQGVNFGRMKVQEVVKVVGGKVIFLIFVLGENVYLKELLLIILENYCNYLYVEKCFVDVVVGKVQLSEVDMVKFKELLLNDGQFVVLLNMKKYIDFNDLFECSSLGKDGVECQVRSVVGKVFFDEGQWQKVQQFKQ